MTYKEKLIDLLKSVDSINSAMNTPIIGNNVKYESYTENIHGTNVTFEGGEGVICDTTSCFMEGENGNTEEEIYSLYIYNKNASYERDILSGVDIGRVTDFGVPLQERFIRMYCENKGIYNSIWNSNIDIEDKCIEIDNTKDFDNQSDDVYKQIFLALNV